MLPPLLLTLLLLLLLQNQPLNLPQRAPVTEETTPSAPVSKGNSFIGFVIDETGSMSNEIDAVKTWLTNCVTGSYTDCTISPTGGWILSSFNDPSDGILVGPT